MTAKIRTALPILLAPRPTPRFKMLLLAAMTSTYAGYPPPGAADNHLVTGQPALTVTSIQPQRSEIPQTLSANGSIAAWQEAVISAQAQGLRLQEIRAEIGDKVSQGQRLARFDTETLQAEVAQSRAQLGEAEAGLAEAELNANRARKVVGTGALSAQQIDQYLSAEKAAKAKVAAAKAMLDVRQLQLKHSEIVANDDGVISARGATLGAVPALGQELFRLIRDNRLEWRAELVGGELARLRPGITVVVEVPDVGKIVGSIRTLAPALDPQNRYGLVYVDLPGAAEAGLRAGMFARGEFRLATSQGLTIPQDAITTRDGFDYVYRLQTLTNSQAKVEQIKVQVGQHLGQRLEIVAGIGATDHLVANGGAFLNDGDLVRVVAP